MHYSIHHSSSMQASISLWACSSDGFHSLLCHVLSTGTTHCPSLPRNASATVLKQARCLTCKRRTKRCLQQWKLQHWLLHIKAAFSPSRIDEAFAWASGLLHRASKQKRCKCQGVTYIYDVNCSRKTEWLALCLGCCVPAGM